MHTAKAREVIDVCGDLAACTEEPGFTTRTFLSEPMHEVHSRLRGWMQRIGMSTSIDSAGNLRGVYDGATPAAPPLFIGSHLDTVPHAGRFDGVLGVVAGIALVDLLAGRRFPFSIEVVGFSEEEGVRFGVPFIGSRALAGTFDETLLRRPDAAGRTVREAILDYGLDPTLAGQAVAPKTSVGYLEMHIEQGPVLDALGLPLGIVETIAGQTRAHVRFAGAANHAGTTPMDGRHDALTGAAEWILEVERLAKSTPGLVATVGRIDVEPGASNAVPGSCLASLDVRHADDWARRAAVDRLKARADEIAAARGLLAGCDVMLDQAATPMDGPLTGILAQAVERSGAFVHRMASGAGHDAMVLAGRLPTAMLFLRSPGGVSHHPGEAVLESDVAAALGAGMEFFEGLARSRSWPTS